MSVVAQNGGDKPMKLGMRILNFVQRVIVYVGRILFHFYYRNDGKRVPPISNPLLLESATSIAEKIRKKKITSEEVLNTFIERIKEVNPVLNTLVEDRFEEALIEARATDRIIKDGTMTEEKLAKEKPFFGVPFTTKDCIAVKGLHNTCGLVSRKDVIAEADAVAIQLIRKAGAIPLGLTNVSELCMWWESHNYVHGRTSNPHDTTRIVGGSSGGEGCIQAAAGSAFGIGSDIGGSIRMPCMFNGIFGHKPTKFSVSNVGQYPEPGSEFQMSFLGTGPMTRRAADLKPILQVMAGDYAPKFNLDKPVDIKNLNIFYQLDSNNPLVCPVDPEIQDSIVRAVNHLEKNFNLKAKKVYVKKLTKAAPIWFSNMKVTDAPTFGELIIGSDSFLSIFTEIVKNIFGTSPNTFIGLVTALVDKRGGEPGTEQYNKYFKLRQSLEDEFKEMLGDNGVFIFPTHPTTALYHNEPLIRSMNFCYTAIFNALGFPATHVPMGLSKDGLPLGFQIVGNLNSDRLTIAVAEELDREFHGWVEPWSTKKDN